MRHGNSQNKIKMQASSNTHKMKSIVIPCLMLFCLLLYDYMDKRPTLTCKICGVPKEEKVLGMHIYNKHKVTTFEYAIKYLGHSKNPSLCLCGCGKETAWQNMKHGWKKYVHGHNYHKIVKDDYKEVMGDYKAIGYECLIVWDYEIYENADETKKKIKAFLENI